MQNRRILCGSLFITLFLLFFFYVTVLYAQVERGAAVPFESLPSELKQYDIKDYFISSSSKQVGVIHGLNNSVVVIHRADNSAYFGREGDSIFENDSLFTLEKARCRIRLLNEDVITLASDTSFSVDSYIDQKDEGRKRSLFSMIKGKAMFYAMRLFKYKESRFDLKTPTAVVGVRGTKFGVYVFEKEASTAGLEVRVADASSDFSTYLAQAQPGPEIVTLVTSGDGQVTANGIPINPGEVYSSDTNIVTYDPTVLSNIEADTRVETRTGTTTGGEETGQTGGEEAATATTGGDETDLTATADQVEAIQDTTQQETGTTTEETAKEDTEIEGTLYGYFAALVTHYSTPYLQDVFVPTELQETSGSNVVGKAIDHIAGQEADTWDYIVYDDTAGAFTYASIYDEATDTYGVNGAINVPTSGEWSQEGIVSNSYQWGYWNGSSQKFPDSNPIFAVDNKIWGIEGYPTYYDFTSSWPAGSSYNYNFDTNGTYWTSNGGIDLSGSGSCSVDFTSGGEGSIYDFYLEALSSDELYGAKITHDGAEPISNGEFFFADYDSYSSGTYELRKGTTEWEDAYWGQVSGTFYGEKADIGIGWSVYDNSDASGAGGIAYGPGEAQ